MRSNSNIIKTVQYTHCDIFFSPFRYALSVFENANLRQIFDMDRLNLSITHGNVYFQNNRMLCYRKIEALAQRLGLANQFSDIDVSQYSNGYKAICKCLCAGKFV
jgi:hypothetical protein